MTAPRLVESTIRHQRLAPLRASAGEPYRYEEEVEEFLRRSPSVRRAEPVAEAPRNIAPGRRNGGSQAALPGYDDLRADEIIGMLGGLEPAALRSLREHEANGAGRKTVLAAIDRRLQRA